MEQNVLLTGETRVTDIAACYIFSLSKYLSHRKNMGFCFGIEWSYLRRLIYPRFRRIISFISLLSLSLPWFIIGAVV